MAQTESETKRGIAAIRRFARPFKRELATIGALGVLSAIANGSVPYVTGRFFDALINLSQGRMLTGWNGLPLWGVLLGAWVLIQLVANNADWIDDRLRRRMTLGIHLNIQYDGFDQIFKLPLSYHKNTHINGELQKLSTAGWRVSGIIQILVSITPQLLSILIGIVLAATINPWLAGVLLCGVLLYCILLLRILAPAAKLDSAAHKIWNESWDDAAAAVMQVESVKAAAAEGYESAKARDGLLKKTYTAWHKIEVIWSNVNFFQRIIVFLTQLAVFLFSVRLVANGSLTVGQLIALNGYAAMFFGPFVQLGYGWQQIQNGITAASHAETIFREPKENYVPADAVAPASLHGEVEFDHVSFSYGDKEKDVLADVSFKVKPGEVVAFVGESGVGKSTTVSLISGYNFPAKGHIRVDGVDTRRYDLGALRRGIAVVPQEVALFNDSIKANIRYGTFDASDDDVTRAAREAHIEEFIKELPQGYDAVVGERGIKLSVGQKQRVAIARAVLRNPAILILDEPTSALDAHTEKLVTESLEKLMRGRTTFIIAHRLSTVRKADTIFVFEKGKIVESGSHDELTAIKGGVYRRLYEYQIGLH
ncbi:MAG: ABC transporter ATP-binding protein [Candidatus Pacebacteria bacterium]|nr:ABC transporter ATP-binding protein [Candidatus Paceibacterota bacterium]